MDGRRKCVISCGPNGEEGEEQGFCSPYYRRVIDEGPAEKGKVFRRCKEEKGAVVERKKSFP